MSENMYQIGVSTLYIFNKNVPPVVAAQFTEYFLVPTPAVEEFIASQPGATLVFVLPHIFADHDSARAFADYHARQVIKESELQQHITINCVIFGENRPAIIPANRRVCQTLENLQVSYKVFLNCPTCGHEL